MRTDTTDNASYSPDNFSTLTKFLQREIVMSLTLYTYLDQRGLVNRGRCPYTGETIDNPSSYNWTYMRSRKIDVSQRGYEFMKREATQTHKTLPSVASIFILPSAQCTRHTL